ncbi:MAG: hypothetical protein Q8R47_06790 [Nanoarchaeota archaeon]|nr:hypothetical protein [Nanoarchaeota archaeon]
MKKKVHQDGTSSNTLPEKFKELIEQNQWIFAKTYAKTAPHEYIVKYKIDSKWWTIMVDFATFINKEGYEYMFFDKKYICYNYKEHRYWTMDEDVEKTNLINRAVN